MLTVLIAQPDVKFATDLATPLLAAGYRAITCPWTLATGAALHPLRCGLLPAD